MSLVAYGSSDDSDSEETSASQSKGSSSGGLFSLLPTPKKPVSAGGGSRKETRVHRSGGHSKAHDDPDQPPSKGGLISAFMPKPRKRTEPVKITAPQIQRRDSDSDEDHEPAKKKVQTQGSGLSSLLPQPKHMTRKAMDRSLIPHTLTKRQPPKGPKPGTPTQGLLGSSASPSAIKAAAKSAALQVARQIATDDQDNEEDISPQNYFSLAESSQPLPAVIPSLDPEPGPPAEPLAPAPAPADEPGQSDAPLDFGAGGEGAGPWGAQYPQYQQEMEGTDAPPQGFYNQPYVQDPEAGSAEADEPGSSAMFDEEAFMRLQGKRNRGKEEVKFLEIKGDDQLSSNKQWMTKNITEEKQTRQSFSKKKGEGPTGQQRRKHQITYLIHQAKERELELKNNWADNKLTRRQTQAKYGF
ncbi:proline-rich protein PRCC [Pseudochaenichthys georgianus]|uniref:proline-rich protein PRCC n=1 Tax=Pseudochaenichthys georgianus TaxID=52239 RepID=UPI00146D941F|nr:proline-rich protein PRCC [Pseudochaenichthys georgianus]